MAGFREVKILWCEAMRKASRICKALLQETMGQSYDAYPLILRAEE